MICFWDKNRGCAAAKASASPSFYSISSYRRTRQSCSYSSAYSLRVRLSTSPLWLSYGSYRRNLRGGLIKRLQRQIPKHPDRKGIAGGQKRPAV